MKGKNHSIGKRFSCLDFEYHECHVLDVRTVGDGNCDTEYDDFGIRYNTEKCGWDGGDCTELNEMYPGCKADCSSCPGNDDGCKDY